MLRRTSIPQRVVLVVSLGVLLLSGWSWWYFGEVAQANSGWFAYAPQQETDTYWHSVTDRRFEFLIVPVVLVFVWAAVSLWLLGLSEDSDAT